MAIQTNTWIKTDNFQWVKQQDEHTFQVVTVINFNEIKKNYYVIKSVTVPLNKYSNEAILDAVTTFEYEDIEHVKEKHPDTHKQVIAECIANLTNYHESNSDHCYEGLQQVENKLYELYQIKLIS
ncbi:hypothetical protein [Bacillus cereus]|uniref:hypothetical protein n=1 Tax=Bacillus cereus TaxID=1396 RepID=UPI000B4AAC81|nr:hypothetical protein [Bacillus cereus]